MAEILLSTENQGAGLAHAAKEVREGQNVTIHSLKRNLAGIAEQLVVRLGDLTILEQSVNRIEYANGAIVTLKATDEAEDPAEITEQSQRSYVRLRTHGCPYCKSPNITNDLSTAKRTHDSDREFITYEVECAGCNKRWRDVYALSHIEEIK